MKKKIVKVLDNLTDEFVPDRKETIMNAIGNESHHSQIIRFSPKRKPILKYASVAACCAFLLLSVLTVNLFNTDSPILFEGDTPNSSTTSISGQNSQSNADENINQNNVFVETPVFNSGALSALKIGGIAEKTTVDKVQERFNINSLPYDLECSFLYPLNSTDSVPFACSLNHTSTDKWFNCIVSTEKLVDYGMNEYEYTQAGEMKIIFSKDDGYLYASFAMDGMNFLLEAEGFTEIDFVGIVNLLID